eukprot:sb/3472494/
MFEEQFDKNMIIPLFQMQSGGGHYIVVVYHESSDLVVGSATLQVEHKIIHTVANRGRIEDVVVHPEHQGREFGKMLLDVCILLAESTRCYKLSLDCNEKDTLIVNLRVVTYLIDCIFTWGYEQREVCSRLLCVVVCFIEEICIGCCSFILLDLVCEPISSSTSSS